MIEQFQKWIHDIIGYVVSFLCLICPKSYDDLANFVAVLIGVTTFLFITLPKAWPNIKKFFGRVIP